MDLPSFLWLWKIAAWSMGLSVSAYCLLAVSGVWMFSARVGERSRPNWLRLFHFIVGGSMVFLVILLLAVGLVGTIGHYGSLGHSVHLPAGLLVVLLVMVSAGSATQIGVERPWARSLHIATNIVLFFGFAAVSLTGWVVVQKNLP